MKICRNKQCGTWHSLHYHEQATSCIHQSWQDQAVSQAMTKLNRFNTKVPRERLFVIHQTCMVQTNQVQGSFCMQVRHHGEMIHTDTFNQCRVGSGPNQYLTAL